MQQGDGQGSNEREVRVGRLQRQKVRVARNCILDSAAKFMEMYSSQKAVLEVEYFGEVGTGLGPTLEFYTLLSHDLQKVDLGMWRSNCSFDDSCMEIDSDNQSKDGFGGNANLVQSPLGLFPRPWIVSWMAFDFFSVTVCTVFACPSIYNGTLNIFVGA